MRLTVEQLKSILKNASLYRKCNLKASCPKCNEKEFYISYEEENHPFQCWRKKHCGYSGNIFTLLKDLGKLSLLGDFKTTDLTVKLKTKLVISSEEIDINLPNLPLPLAFKFVKEHDYLKSRDFHSYHKIRFGVTQLDPKFARDYIIFVIEDSKGIKGFIGRHIWNRMDIDRNNILRRQQGLPDILRYRNSETDFSKLLGGIDEITDETITVILVEGIFDKDNVDYLLELDNQKEIKCCCTYGSSLSSEQVYLLQQKQNVKNLIILHEADVIGKVKNTSSYASLYFDNVLVGYVKDKDPGDMNHEDLEQVLLNLTNDINFFINKVKIVKFV